MEHHCLLCGAPIQDPEKYLDNERRYVRTTEISAHHRRPG